MEDIGSILKIIISWPTATIIGLIALRQPITSLIQRLIESDSGKAKLGPLEIELGKLAEKGKQAVDNMKQINYIMAESRLLELEITEGKFGPIFSDDQRKKMRKHIEELSKLTKK